jgi:hypothetical protein
MQNREKKYGCKNGFFEAGLHFFITIAGKHSKSFFNAAN